VILAMGAAKQATHAIDRMLREEQRRKVKNTFSLLSKILIFKVLGMQKLIISGIGGCE
jgi:NhaP-type Na+/H+ or K+/H+ antiporter